MTRIVDRGAVTAAFVGIGMAVTIAISFLLVIPIEPIYWLLSLPAGLLIGYYANQRSGRRRGIRLVTNPVLAGLATGLTLAAVLLGVKALFFFGDNGYPDFNRIDRETGLAVPPFCHNGADCVYQRYLADGRGTDLAALGVADVTTFATYYWNQQLATSGLLGGLATAGGLAGGLLFAVTGRNRNAPAGAGALPSTEGPG